MMFLRSRSLFKSLGQLHIETLQSLEPQSMKWDWASERCLKLLPRMNPAEIGDVLSTFALKNQRDTQVFFMYSKEILRREEANEEDDIPPPLQEEHFAKALDAYAELNIKNEVLYNMILKKLQNEKLEWTTELGQSITKFRRTFNV